MVITCFGIRKAFGCISQYNSSRRWHGVPIVKNVPKFNFMMIRTYCVATKTFFFLNNSSYRDRDYFSSDKHFRLQRIFFFFIKGILYYKTKILFTFKDIPYCNENIIAFLYCNKNYSFAKTYRTAPIPFMLSEDKSYCSKTLLLYHGK